MEFSEVWNFSNFFSDLGKLRLWTGAYMIMACCHDRVSMPCFRIFLPATLVKISTCAQLRYLALKRNETFVQGGGSYCDYP